MQQKQKHLQRKLFDQKHKWNGKLRLCFQFSLLYVGEFYQGERMNDENWTKITPQTNRKENPHSESHTQSERNALDTHTHCKWHAHTECHFMNNADLWSDDVNYISSNQKKKKKKTKTDDDKNDRDLDGHLVDRMEQII